MAMPVAGVPTESPAAHVPAGHALARIGRAIRSNRKAATGTILLLIFVLIALFPWVIARDSPTTDAYQPHLGASAAHLLGTNAYGQDLFAQVVWGTRNVLIISVVVGLATLVKRWTMLLSRQIRSKRDSPMVLRLMSRLVNWLPLSLSTSSGMP